LYSPAPVTAVSTGVGATNVSSAANKKEVYTKIKELKKATHRHAASELDDKVLSQENRSINHTESAYDTGLLSSPKHLERVHSMTYSDSTGEDDDKDRFVQLPPPVAPGYKDTLAMKQHTFPPQASAPMEELKVPPPILTVDFPGLPMPPSSIQSALTETLSPSDFKSKALAETPSPSTSKSPAQTYEQEAYPVLAEAFPEPKFNYMKTINKVVHASKKKGRKVMERMTVTTISSDHQLQQRVADLEKQNEALRRENVALFEKNQQLQQLNDWLQNDKSKEIHVHEIETISSESTETKHDPPRRQKTETTPLVDMVARQESRCDKACDSIKDRRVSVGTTISEQECTNAPDQMYDNPLFRHMATMNNQSTSRWNHSNAKAHVTHSYERSYDLEDGDAFSEDSNDENDPDSKEVGGQTTLFDDPLLQHMAMMNNM
jgi:cell division protein FtsB